MNEFNCAPLLGDLVTVWLEVATGNLLAHLIFVTGI